MDIAAEMVKLIAALPASTLVREACLTLDKNGTWQVLAGGFNPVHIGEWGGDFQGEGATPEEAFSACLQAITKTPD